jgi:glycerol-3-phosphate acyltransferase PlsY
MPPFDALVGFVRVTLVLVAGYLIGSLPVTGWIGSRAGVTPGQGAREATGVVAIWTRSGPGAGLLALGGEVAKGVVPVAIALVTFGWWTGWVAAVGAVAGAARPGFGPRTGGSGITTLAGACVALAPLSGVLALAVAALVAGAGRLSGRDARGAAVVAGFAVFLALAVVELADATRLMGLGLLLLGTGLWASSARGTGRAGAG